MQVEEMYSMNYSGFRNYGKDHLLPLRAIPPFSLTNGTSILFKAALRPTKIISQPPLNLA